MENIIEQLKNNCSCIENISNDDLKLPVMKMINYISILTCWKSDVCDNFLTSMREEQHYINKNIWGCCDNGIFIIHPYYKFKNMETLEAYVYHRDGIKDVVTLIDSEDFYYSDIDDEIRFDLKKYLPQQTCLSCPVDYKLVVKYEAGLNEIPECLLDDFCHILNLLFTTDIGCDDCCDINEDQPYGAYLSHKKVGEISYTWKVDEDDLDRRMDRLMNLATFKNIASISLCTSSLEIESWGTVEAKCIR